MGGARRLAAGTSVPRNPESNYLSKSSKTDSHSVRLSTKFEPYSNLVTFLKLFRFSDARFNGNDVATIFGKQRSLPLRFADPSMYRNHPPTISHES